MAEQQGLSPEEMEALLGAGAEDEKSLSPVGGELSADEIKILSGVMTRSMEACGNVLETTLNRKAALTNLQITEEKGESLRDDLPSPTIVAELKYTRGIKGETLIILPKVIGAAIADLMMGGDGSSPPEELNELYLGAVNEVLCQMMSAGSGTFASSINRGVEIGAPKVNVVDLGSTDIAISLLDRDVVIKIVGSLSIEGFENNLFTQLIGLDLAKVIIAAYSEGKGVHPVQFAPLGAPGAGVEGNLGLLMDIPVSGAVELGRTEMLVKNILSLGPGSIVELNREAGEPVDLLINGKLIAKGEVVVIDNDFGIKITEIISPADRVPHI